MRRNRVTTLTLTSTNSKMITWQLPCTHSQRLIQRVNHTLSNFIGSNGCNIRQLCYCNEHQWQNETRVNYPFRMLAKNSEFTDINREIKAQSCTSSRLRRRGLREPDLSLQDLLEHGRTLEFSELQASGIENCSKITGSVKGMVRSKIYLGSFAQ